MFARSDLRGYSRLAVDAVLGLTSVVESMHHNIARAPGPFGTFTQEPTRGITGLVYRSIRGVTRLVGGGVDAALAQLVARLEDEPPSAAREASREAIVAALNGVYGDFLAASGNPLAISMRLRRGGEPLELTRQALAAAIPKASGNVVLLAHGLCLNDLQWRRQGHDHGEALAADAGFTPVYLHYNSGLHVSTNGRACAELIEALVQAWPVPMNELVLLGHSMGGLVARSACHHGKVAGHAWLRVLRKVVFLGTPHHGATLERGGNWVDLGLGVSPYTAALARVGKSRSAGITDLRHGSLLDEDWQHHDRFARSADPRAVVPLPDGVQCCAVGASITKKESRLRERLLGDGLVPLPSALGRHADPGRSLDFPEPQRWVGYGMGHFDLLARREVYERILGWLAGPQDGAHRQKLS